MPRKKPGVSMSDRDVLRAKPSKTAPVEPVYPGDSSGACPKLGRDEDSIISAMNWVFANVGGPLEKKDADAMIAAARICLSAVKSKDDKSQIARLQQMVMDAQAAANKGLEREAADRHHTTRDTEPASDEGEK